MVDSIFTIKKKNPFVVFKKGVEEMGIFKMILIHLIMPVVILQSLLSLIIDGLEIIDNFMQDVLDKIIG